MQISRATITLVTKIAASWRHGDLHQSRRMGVTANVSRYNLLTSEARKHAPSNLCRESKRQAGIIPIIIIAVVDSCGGPRDPPPSLGSVPIVIYRASSHRSWVAYFLQWIYDQFFPERKCQVNVSRVISHWKRTTFRELIFGKGIKLYSWRNAQ